MAIGFELHRLLHSHRPPHNPFLPTLARRHAAWHVDRSDQGAGSGDEALKRLVEARWERVRESVVAKPRVDNIRKNRPA